MFEFKFRGTVAELTKLLLGMPEYIQIEACSVQVPVESLEDKAWKAARPLVANGQKIQGIKAWREVTGSGLKEAKDAVEARGAAEGILYRDNQGYWVTGKTV
ncbi:MAG TPA: ribosomal protein L7/L12 [Candidatus Paceibacterota bacterium]